MQSARRIAEKHINFSCLCRMHRIKDHTCRICVFSPCDNIYASSVCPFFKLLYCCCTERICCCQHNLSALLLKLACHFTDTCSLADAVYTDHQHNRLLMFKFICRLTHLHLLLDAVDQKLLTLRRFFDALLFYLVF